ncbi:MAG: aminotransferase class V-fold PLP-dependent enzyme [Sediminimonas sp.]|uniref:aminotransferase class V-fold PLP-dependent enzyme n=1 Tax=Sediminimonas sp. TaxID=2823379 RepID=UPI0028704043|nr:aminotransferase class V-fold PLP-dependent enzyme [Sediminimonas sp.]MDR9485456.1 aminotransferase class V-fold PLP-dependent enzyme [Sediminimonas sp.]
MRPLLPCHPSEYSFFSRFSRSLERPDVIDHLRDGVIGEGLEIPGPDGPRPLIYADYVASGRALHQVEDAITAEVLPYYSNAHTEASHCGRVMNRMRAEARRLIAGACGADDPHAVIFTGSGATAGLSRLAPLLGVDRMVQTGQRPRVLIGPYEHHSNILPWRESGADVVEIPEAHEGGPNRAALEQALVDAGTRPVVGAFSAVSNVTGIVTDVAAITKLLKAHGALSVWDYAAAAPYLPVDMGLGMDAIALSPHKFIGGPGASGVLIVRRDAVARETPTLPGGGTVRFVSPWGHDYSHDVTTREEAGTPNVIGDIRAALCFAVKEAIGQDQMTARLHALRRRALQVWQATPGLHILCNEHASDVLPVFSFRITGPDGALVHPQLVTRILSDHFGIQARGGCACAGPYAHHLLGLGRVQSDRLRTAILAGHEIDKPGWTRLAFSVLMSDAKADTIIRAVDEIARTPGAFTRDYRVDTRTARFTPEAA